MKTSDKYFLSCWIVHAIVVVFGLYIAEPLVTTISSIAFILSLMAPLTIPWISKKVDIPLLWE